MERLKRVDKFRVEIRKNYRDDRFGENGYREGWRKGRGLEVG